MYLAHGQKLSSPYAKHINHYLNSISLVKNYQCVVSYAEMNAMS